MLYIVGTPIGNLDDLSIRQAKTIIESDIVLAEDTRSANILINEIRKRFMFGVSRSTRIISYYKEREFEKLPEILQLLEENKSISLISEAGMPLISDPGYLLVKTLVRRSIPFLVIPGPTAITSALIYSGFPPDKFIFLGFLPKKPGEMIRLINRLNQVEEILPDTVFVFYESPNRINETLKIIDGILPNAEISISRELTKMFEETVRGKARGLMKRNYKGEITVVIKP